MKEKCKNCGSEFDEIDYMHYLFSNKRRVVLNDIDLDGMINEKLCPECNDSRLSNNSIPKKIDVPTI